MQRTAIPNGWLFQKTDTNISDAYSEWTAIPSGRLSQKIHVNISDANEMDAERNYELLRQKPPKIQARKCVAAIDARNS